MAARIINIVLGVWLFISAFAWPHAAGQFTNTWLMGALCVGIALIAMQWREARYLNTLLAVWLFISSFAIAGARPATVWNNVLVAIAIFVVSLFAGPLRTGRLHAGRREPVAQGAR